MLVHAGTLGLTVSAYWWVQGSVLCQRIHRRLWRSDRPLDATHRPVIACVYELALIHAEQQIWREAMMGASPRPAEYLSTRAPLRTV
ncbi:MAG: hypothetical protein AAGC57_02275 [Pseudomonadota bacterium]